MRSIIFSYEIKTSKASDICNGIIKKILLNGQYILPLYGLNQDIVEVKDANDETLGHIAIQNIKIIPKEEISEEEMNATGYEKAEIDLLLKDEIYATIADVTPAITDCDCEECDCGGNCNCK